MYTNVSQMDVPDVSAIGSLSPPYHGITSAQMRVNCLQATASNDGTITMIISPLFEIVVPLSWLAKHLPGRPKRAIHFESRDPTTDYLLGRPRSVPLIPTPSSRLPAVVLVHI